MFPGALRNGEGAGWGLRRAGERLSPRPREAGSRQGGFSRVTVSGRGDKPATVPQGGGGWALGRETPLCPPAGSLPSPHLQAPAPQVPCSSRATSPPPA